MDFGSDHESWMTLLATVAAYGLILVGMTVLLFVIPTALFSLF
ncbi:MAG: hypothetical protein V5A38_10615 [Halolamina sp.]